MSLVRVGVLTGSLRGAETILVGPDQLDGLLGVAQREALGAAGSASSGSYLCKKGSIREMKRLLFGLTGFGVIVLGLIISVLTVIDIRRGHLDALIPLVFGFFISCAGLTLVRSRPYRQSVLNDGLDLLFVCRRDFVPWDKVIWHKKIGYRSRFKGEANVWTLLKYARSKGARTVYRMVILLLPGKGPVVGTSAKEYTTVLDERHRGRNERV